MLQLRPGTTIAGSGKDNQQREGYNSRLMFVNLKKKLDAARIVS
jgi:hypothetical protein